MERIGLALVGRMSVKLNVRAADLSHRHKSDDFNSFLMHLFFEGRRNKEFAKY